MNEIQGVVRRQADGLIWIETQPRSGCRQCQTKNGCTSVSIARLFCASPRLFSFPSTHNLEIGDIVAIGMQEQWVLKSALLAYGLPVLALLTGAWLGQRLTMHLPDFGSIMFGGAFFLLSILAVRVWEHRLKRSGAGPVLLRKISGPTIAVHSR